MDDDASNDGGLTPSERFVTQLCKRSFLKLCTHPNPKGKQGKELCDCLVVCGPHIVIISVKEIAYHDTADKTGWNRWTKAAIDKSAAQIFGAERWLESVKVVERDDGRTITLPPKGERRYHRLSVSLGAKGHVPLRWGELGKGFVHLCDEFSVDVLFQALDTITDFTNFLDAAEALIRRNVKVLFAGGGIEDFVAIYLNWNRSFTPPDLTVVGTTPDTLLITENIWKAYTQSASFAARRVELKPSYFWDGLIEHFADHLLAESLVDMHGRDVSENELALVAMALQPRWHRLVFAESILELAAPGSKVRARVAQGYGALSFVFLIAGSGDRKGRQQELQLRCVVARDRLRDRPTVIGLAMDRSGTSKVGYSEDLLYFHVPEWTADLSRHAQGIVDKLGYFKDTQWQQSKRM